MTLPSLPAAQSTSWYPWATGVHNRITGPINVKEYGAVGDGSTDDTAAIQAALNAVATGGGIVFLPAGRYKISSTLQASVEGTVIQGATRGSQQGSFADVRGTRLEASGTLSAGPMLLVQEVGNVNPPYGCVMRDLTLDGMGTATGDGCVWRSYQSRIERVDIMRFGGNGLRMQGYAGWNLYDSVISQVELEQNTGAGLYLDTGATDLHLFHSILHDNGINFQWVSGSSIQVTSCHFYTATTDNLLFAGGGSRSKFVGCKIEGAGHNNINMDATVNGLTDVQFIGCQLALASQTTGNTWDEFVIQGSAANGMYKVMLLGCSFSEYGSPANRPRYAVNLGAASQSTTIVGCNFDDVSTFATGVINNAASSSYPAVIMANGGAGYITRSSGTATITSAATTVTINHGLVGVTPTAGNIVVTPTNSMGSSSKFFVSGVTSTQFVINVNVAPGATTATFGWAAEV